MTATDTYNQGFDAGFKAGRQAEHDLVILLLQETALAPVEEHPNFTDQQWHEMMSLVLNNMRTAAPHLLVRAGIERPSGNGS